MDLPVHPSNRSRGLIQSAAIQDVRPGMVEVEGSIPARFNRFWKRFRTPLFSRFFGFLPGCHDT